MIQVKLLEDAWEFLDSLEPQIREKVIKNLDKIVIIKSNSLFKKLQDEIWEIRTKFGSNEYRLLAFWDKRNNQNTLIVATNGFVKKQWKVPRNEIEKAKRLMRLYLQAK